ncbi:MAG: AAA family ATPase, partial [Candidatus Omnitrophica bacterium]|nr:AAA family ATPase [Candidatus Omnitrophota bacterium]
MAKTVVFFSTKGGVGKTLLATNIAVNLSKERSQRVLLLDLDVEAPGDMSKMLGVEPNKALVDLLAFLKEYPADFKKENFLTKLKEDNLDFIPGVLKPYHSSFIKVQEIKKTFELLEKDYDFIIVDAGKNFNDILVSAWEQANLILLVVTPDILSIYQTRWTLDTLHSLFFPLKMVKILLNRAEAISSISWEEIKVSLPIEIIGRIPSEGKVVGLAVNRRVPFVIDSPRSKITKAVSEITQRLVEDDKLYVSHKELKDLRLKEKTSLKKAGEFWEKEGLAESIVIEKEEKEDEILILKRRIHNRLIDELNIRKLDLSVFSDIKKMEELRKRADVLVANLLLEEAGAFISSKEIRAKLTKEILDEALGYGPLEDLLADPEITDIMV